MNRPSFKGAERGKEQSKPLLFTLCKFNQEGLFTGQLAQNHKFLTRSACSHSESQVLSRMTCLQVSSLIMMKFYQGEFIHRLARSESQISSAKF